MYRNSSSRHRLSLAHYPRPDAHYYRVLRREVDGLRIDLAQKAWCDLWHTHFDWQGFGDQGWVQRRRHLNALLRALARVRRELASTASPYQLFALVHPASSGNDALYVHTPNPNETPFPCVFSDVKPVDTLPPLLHGRIDLSRYSVLRRVDDEHAAYIIQPRS